MAENLTLNNYKALLSKAYDFLVENPQAEGVFVALTAKNEYVLMQIITDQHERELAEKDFIGSLLRKEDSVLTRSLCIWHDGTLDVPSGTLLKSLLELESKNKDTLHLCRGTDYKEKRYSSLMGI